MLFNVAILIRSLDPEVAYLLGLVYAKVLGIGRSSDGPGADRIDPQRRVELEAEAAITSLDEAVEIAIATLDRLYPQE